MASTSASTHEIHIPCRAIPRTNTRRSQPHALIVGFLFFGGTLVANTYLARNPHVMKNAVRQFAND